MQNFFFDRRSRKRNRRTEEPQTPEAVDTGERRQQSDRRQEGRSTLEHYYAVHDMDVDELADLDEAAAAAPPPSQRPRGN